MQLSISSRDGEPLTLAVPGANGRLGRFLRAAWAGDAALNPRWMARQGDRRMTAADPLGDPAALARAFDGCDVVLCLAGPTPAPDLPDAAMNAHPAIARAVLTAAEAAHVPHVILISSAAIYGAATGDLTEATAPTPANAYGAAKAALEQVAAGWRGAARVTVLRLGNVAGADMLLGGATARLAAGDASPARLHVFADGASPERSYIGPQTLARTLAMIARALQGGTPVPPVLNLAAPGTVAMADLMTAAALPWLPVPAPETAIPRVELDVSALSRLIRFDPEDCTAAGMVAEWRALTETAT